MPTPSPSLPQLIAMLGDIDKPFISRDDADGRFVQRTAGLTVTYVGAHYEVNSSTGATSYYFFGGKRVAMRQGSTTTWIVGDHLGSASVTLNSSGAIIGQARYMPYGETRWSTGLITTSRRFADQIQDSYSNMYRMGARWYDPLIGRWLSADTLVPQPGNPQSFNRFAYARGNPLRYIDPTGHSEDCAANDTSCQEQVVEETANLPEFANGNWISEEQRYRAILAYLSLRNRPDIWASLFANYDAWCNSQLRTDFESYLESTGQDVASSESVVYSSLEAAYGSDQAQALANARVSSIRAMNRNLPNQFAEASLTASPYIVSTIVTNNWDVDQLSAAAGAFDRNGFTRAGRALQKHSSRPGSVYAQPSGTLNPSSYNQAGQEIVDDILTSPGTTFSVEHRSYYGNVLEVNAADGRSMRYSMNGDFMGFLEP
jgi:RHS repeat-associated protein